MSRYDLRALNAHYAPTLRAVTDDLDRCHVLPSSLGEMPAEEPDRAGPAAFTAFWAFALCLGCVCVGAAARLLVGLWGALPMIGYWFGR